MSSAHPPIIELKNVCKSFKKDSDQDRLVLDTINFTLYDGEIVALLGKSGSGKSTLLRVIAGLIKPSDGEVWYRNKRIFGPAHGIAMVFQNFALLPWLTVLENVELGLEALGVKRDERRKRALAAIDTIGMDGFESAYPKELSGGMRQRVGFARALVINPDILLMDEPFSALDVLTSDNLKHDLLDLWQSKKTQTNAILFVTHNIEEAAILADRIIIFDSDPGRIRAILNVKLTHPRSEQDPDCQKVIDEIYTLMTTREPQATISPQMPNTEGDIGLGYRLPDTGVAEITGLIDTVNDPEYQGKMDLPELADYLSLDIDDLFPITEAVQLLQFAKVSAGDIMLTEQGIQFSAADILERKNLFSKHLLSRIPLAKHIYDELHRRPGHRLSKDEMAEALENYLSEKEAERVLRVIIDWGRYAEIFAYDDNASILSLEDPT